MPSLLIYEYLTASRVGEDPASPDHSLYREGRAMRDALQEDFARLPGFQVTVAEQRTDLESAGCHDRVIVIAPETEGILLQDLETARSAGGKVMGCSREAVLLTADKLALARHWQEHGIPTPVTYPWQEKPPIGFPRVVKPRDGAGSMATYRVDRAEEWPRILAEYARSGIEGIVQEWIDGQPASVACVIGPGGTVALPPAFQTITAENTLAYQGGQVPIPADLARRAERLARAALGVVPGLWGYVGVDLILGSDPSGTRDYALEINPRFTTSYVGLRRLCVGNLAEHLWAIETGTSCPDFRWKPGVVRFPAAGQTNT